MSESRKDKFDTELLYAIIEAAGANGIKHEDACNRFELIHAIINSPVLD